MNPASYKAFDDDQQVEDDLVELIGSGHPNPVGEALDRHIIRQILEIAKRGLDEPV